MKYGDIKTRQDAIDMLEAELITTQDYINICHFNKWHTHDGEREQLNATKNNYSKSNVIRLKMAQPQK